MVLGGDEYWWCIREQYIDPPQRIVQDNNNDNLYRVTYRITKSTVKISLSLIPLPCRSSTRRSLSSLIQCLSVLVCVSVTPARFAHHLGQAAPVVNPWCRRPAESRRAAELSEFTIGGNRYSARAKPPVRPSSIDPLRHGFPHPQSTPRKACLGLPRLVCLVCSRICL